MTDKMPAFRIKLRSCPWCGYRVDGAAAMNGDQAPSDGDLALCLQCGEWAFYEGDHLRKPTEAEYMEIGTDEHCREVRAAWVGLDRVKKGEGPLAEIECLSGSMFDGEWEARLCGRPIGTYRSAHEAQEALEGRLAAVRLDG